HTQINIADNGAGISEEDFPHLFERFYKGKESNPENAGIGLALSRMIIRRQNGTIKIKHVSPHGTEFVITFYKGAI
ncbi:MAG: sensor histidine kinase, partial [Eubacteriales bacterium]|nr:sensor histidine kinase [Eubacteriales bacterium]